MQVITRQLDLHVTYANLPDRSLQKSRCLFYIVKYALLRIVIVRQLEIRVIYADLELCQITDKVFIEIMFVSLYRITRSPSYCHNNTSKPRHLFFINKVLA